MAKLAITFEDTDAGLMLSVSPEMEDVVKRLMTNEPLTPAEMAAAMEWAHIHGAAVAANEEMRKITEERIAAEQGWTTKEIDALNEHGPCTGACGGDCANCPCKRHLH